MTKMTWNHRVLRTQTPYGTEGEIETWYAIHEVHYINGKPSMCTDVPTDVSGESLDELKLTLKRMRRALKEPALELYKTKGGKTKLREVK